MNPKHLWVALIFFCSACLQACSEKPRIYRAFNVSAPDQVFKESMLIKTSFYYKISIVFDWKYDDFDRMLEQKKIIGTSSEERKGVTLPLHVKVIKDNEVLVDEIFLTYGRDSLTGFCLNELTGREEPQTSFLEDLFFDSRCTDKPNRRDIWGPTRTVMGMDFSPGHYLFEITTIGATKELSEYDSFIKIIPYSPKI